MADHRLYDDFAARLGDNIPDSEKPLVNSLLGEAEDTVLDMIGRNALPENGRLDSAVVLLAVAAYNKRGAEGESSRSEGGISRVFDDLPPAIRRRIENYPRKVGTVRAVNGS